MWRCFYAVTKLFFIHSTINFYTTSASKTFLGIKNFYASIYLFFQISNFGEDEIVSMFYAHGLHVLCIVPKLIIHWHSGKCDVSGGNHVIQISNLGKKDEIIYMFICSCSQVSMRRRKHDVSVGNHGCAKWNVHITERFLRGNEIIFIHQTTNIYAISAPKTFLRILTIDSMHPISHHVPRFKF
jgi:hypothetical protein